MNQLIGHTPTFAKIGYLKGPKLKFRKQRNPNPAGDKLGPFQVEIRFLPLEADDFRVEVWLNADAPHTLDSFELHLPIQLGGVAAFLLFPFCGGQPLRQFRPQNLPRRPGDHLANKVIAKPITSEFWEASEHAYRAYHRLGVQLESGAFLQAAKANHLPFLVFFDIDKAKEQLVLQSHLAGYRLKAREKVLDIAFRFREKEAAPTRLLNSRERRGVYWLPGTPLAETTPQQAQQATEALKNHRLPFHYIGLDLSLRLDHLLEDYLAEQWTPHEGKLQQLADWAQTVREAGYKPAVSVEPLGLPANSQLIRRHEERLLLIGNRKSAKVPAFNAPSTRLSLLNLSHPAVNQQLGAMLSWLNSHFDYFVVNGLRGLLNAEYTGTSTLTVLQQTCKFFQEIFAGKPLVFNDLPLDEDLLNRSDFGIGFGPRPSSTWPGEKRPQKGQAPLFSTQGLCESCWNLGHFELNFLPIQTAGFTLLPRSKALTLSYEEREQLLYAHYLFSRDFWLGDPPSALEPGALQTLQAAFPLTKEIRWQPGGGNALQDSLSWQGHPTPWKLLVERKGERNNLPLEAGQLLFVLGEARPRPAEELSFSANEVKIWQLQNREPAEIRFLGSTTHLLPGSELTQFEPDTAEEELSLRLHKAASPAGDLWLLVPDVFDGLLVNGQYYRAQQFGRYRLVLLSARNCPR